MWISEVKWKHKHLNLLQILKIFVRKYAQQSYFGLPKYYSTALKDNEVFNGKIYFIYKKVNYFYRYIII